MGKPTGFLEFQRQPIPDRPPLERVKDWKEIHDHRVDENVSTQGSRCMDCGTPYCHTGMTLAGVASGCPVNNLIPEWNDLVYRGRWKEALSRLRKTNNFPEFTGRVCPAPCEGSCVLGVIEHIGSGLVNRHRARAGDRVGNLARVQAQGFDTKFTICHSISR